MDYRLRTIIKEAPIEYLSCSVAGAVRTIIKSNQSDEQKLVDIMEVIEVFENRLYREG